ncbi:unnamed protein product [Rhizoctonia solani]|uniref:Uncharacterized protein n=1 Tax=Rhizoctonia solani TaxID=456999 RepID=A0A8H2XVB3_9AGAM|nr:unnamed protein product [Rhizoctonia solani]
MILRRGSRTIRPTRNPDGSERAPPLRTYESQGDDGDDSGNYEPTMLSQSPSLGDPINHSPTPENNFSLDLDFLDNRQRAMLMGNQSDDNVVNLVESVASYHDMGPYLLHFADHPDPLTANSRAASPTHTSNPTSTLEQLTSVPEQLDENHAGVLEEVLSEHEELEHPYQILQSVLNGEFGRQKDLFLSTGHLLATSGHHAILGARLLNQVSKRYGVGPNHLGSCRGVEFSLDDIADWMGTRLRTIQNWQTKENRRVKYLNLLDHISSTDWRPRHDTMKRILKSLEGVDADPGVQKLVELDRYLAGLDGRAVTGL